MRKIFGFILFIAIGANLQFANGQASFTGVFENDDISIKFPSTWRLDKSGENETVFTLFAPVKEGSFGTNINFVVQDLSATPMSHSDYIKLTEKQIVEILDKGKVVKSEKISGDQGDYQRLVYSATFASYQLQWLQYIWVRNNKAFALTLTSLKKSFKKDQPEAELIFKTIQFK